MHAHYNKGISFAIFANSSFRYSNLYHFGEVTVLHKFVDLLINSCIFISSHFGGSP